MDPELASFSLTTTPGVNPPAVHLDQPPGQGETNAESTLRLRGRGIDLGEQIEDFRNFLR
jgi:hypothetical protein